MENDANLGPLGEHADGAAQGVDDVVYLKLSTGVGAGPADRRRALHRLDAASPARSATFRSVRNGSICRCGNRGCLETVASAGAVTRALASTAGDAPARERLLGDVGRHVARALAPLCMALDVELVVVGGELGSASPRLVTALRAELRRACLMPRPVTIRAAALGGRAEALGAVALALTQEAWLRDAGLIALNRADAA